MNESTCCKGSFSDLWPLTEAPSPAFCDDIATAFLRDGIVTGVKDRLDAISNSPVTDALSLLSRQCDLLAISLVVEMSREDTASLNHCIRNTLRRLHSTGMGSQVQVLEALVALNGYFAGVEFSSPSILQWESGGVPLQRMGYWKWALVPHTGFQALLGLLWALLGAVTGVDGLIQAAERAATWQCNTLDAFSRPHIGLLTREEDADLTCQLVDNYLLFRAVSRTTRRGEWQALADKQYDLLRTLKVQGRLGAIRGYQRLCEVFLDKTLECVTAKETSLVEDVFDRETLLLGKRTPEESVACTLCGGGTSLGTYRVGETAIIGYGPQNLPLGDCGSFGVVSDPSRASDAVMERQGDSFTLHGRVRLAGLSTGRLCLFRQSRHPGVWLDVMQKYRPGELSIAIDVMSLQPLEATAFVFFATSDRCIVEGGTIVKPRSLDRYQGSVQTITLAGDNTLTIHAGSSLGQMEVIPLAGNRNFWGADFLIAYHLDPSTTQYSWAVCHTRP